jgi:hypothetical protein
MTRWLHRQCRDHGHLAVSTVMKLIHQDAVDHALPSAEFDDDRPIGRLATLN